MTTTSLTGRRALVTGGSRGIGADIVRRLAADGAAVAFTYGASAAEADKLVAEVSASGATVVAIQADSADPAQVAAAVEQAVAALGGLDVLVNNAGAGFVAPIETSHRTSSTASWPSTSAECTRPSAARSAISVRDRGSSTSAASTRTGYRCQDCGSTRLPRARFPR